MLLQNFQMCFDCSFCNNGRSQICETDQVTASEASILATHWTIESTWISWCFLQKQRWWRFTTRHGSFLGRITWATIKGCNVIWEFGRLWKSNQESGEVAKIHMRTDAKNLVTTVRTIHLFEQKTCKWSPRKEACSGSIHDLAHIPTKNCVAACLMKASAKADNLRADTKTDWCWHWPWFFNPCGAQGLLVNVV